MTKKVLGKADCILRKRTVWLQQQQQAPGKAGENILGRKQDERTLDPCGEEFGTGFGHLRAGGGMEQPL